jgi:glycosyltransferase involved in cell wall biosynthesis
MKIAIVVHGRFHAFDLAAALLRRGHDVTLLTNYPERIARRYGVPPDRVHSFLLHGVLTRLVHATRWRWLQRAAEAPLHQLFGRWATRRLASETWDVIHCWSGVAEEVLAEPRLRSARRVLMRGSAHIRVQHQLLVEEERRCGRRIDRPSAWMIRRELREYAASDRIAVLSSFAKESFEQEGVASDRLALLPLGVEPGAFAADTAAVEGRRLRLLDGGPLRVLYVGSLSFQKGLLDMARVIEDLAGPGIRFRLVGSVMPEAEVLAGRLRGLADISGPVEQSRLPAVYRDADVFVFPTVQDGFGMVLTQALAAGLPVIASDHCAAPDLVVEGVTGWIIPARRPQAVAARLRWCLQNRATLAEMTGRIATVFRPRDWVQVAADFERLCDDARRTDAESSGDERVGQEGGVSVGRA